MTVKAASKLSYLITARTVQQKILTIYPGMVESGEILGSEIKQHRMTFPFDKDDEHSFITRLHLITGEADLYMKLCPKSGDCELTKDEIAQEKSPNVFKNVDKTSIKTVQLPVVCTKLASPILTAGTFASDSCIFGIFIVGKNASGTGKVHYELSIEDTIESHLMIRDNFLRVK